MPFPYVFTFYSYKGGVGRSLALTNVAYKLASWGRHVLMVDMDLEAPGVGGMLDRIEELSPRPPKDLLDLLTIAQSEPAEMPPVFEFIRSVLPEKLVPLKPKYGEVGRLDILAPDTTRDYTNRLAGLSLQDAGQQKLIDLGRFLNRYFKSQRFSYRPIGVEDVEDPISSPYDYILVDSRTGFTELGGLCVGPLADRLVVLTGLNDQNINGTLDFLREVGIQLEPRPTGGEAWDDADPNDRSELPSLGPKPTIVVASPVPSGEIEFKRARLEELKAKIGIKPLRVSYHPRLALMETVFVRDFDDELPAVEYTRLATRVTSEVGDSPQQLAKKLEENGTDLNLGLRLLSQEPDLAGAVAVRLGDDDSYASQAGRRVVAELALGAGSPDAFNFWGAALHELAKTESGDEADRFFQQSFEKYAVAVRLKPDYASAFNNWGNALLSLAKTKTGSDAAAIFEDARRKLQQAGSKGLYNRACLEALLENPTQSLHYLEAARDAGTLPSRTHISEDSDFNRIRNHPGFTLFLEQLQK